MIFKRFAANLRAQNWFAIGIEFAIVVAGVFVGMQVTNWNADRLERKEIRTLLHQLRPEIANRKAALRSQCRYLAVTDRYAHAALAAWDDDPSISDLDFVIASYQASQIIGSTIEGNAYSLLLGGEQVRKIDDEVLRNALIRLLTYNYRPVAVEVLQSRYRDEVRRILPQLIQERIRAKCGDRVVDGAPSLPSSCNIDLPDVLVTKAAQDLRERPDLAGDLRQHLSAVSTFLFNVARLEKLNDAVSAAIGDRQ